MSESSLVKFTSLIQFTPPPTPRCGGFSERRVNNATVWFGEQSNTFLRLSGLPSCTLEDERGTTLSIIVLRVYSGRDNNRWPLSVHLVYQLGCIRGTITRLSAHTREGDYGRNCRSARSLCDARKISPGRRKKRASTRRRACPLNEIRNALREKVGEWWISLRRDEEDAFSLHKEIAPLNMDKNAFDGKSIVIDLIKRNISILL